MQFQAICSKWNKKLTLSLTASNREEARDILHKQGYSIIEIQETVDTTPLQEGNFFYFDIVLNGQFQTGKIQSDDIFKAYKKLVEDLKYDVQYIYTAPDVPEDQKKIITAKVKDGYRMYLESIGGKVEDTVDILKKDDTEEFSPQLLKELEKYGKIVDETIVKIQNILVANHEIITPEQKTVLERIEMDLVGIKGMRNIGKIQSTLETALKQIGMIELEILKKWAIKEKAKFLAETNKLLQWVGSNEKIQTEEDKNNSLEGKFQSFLKLFTEKKEEKKPTNEGKLDTNTFAYFKNKRELDIYKKAHQKNNSAIMNAILTGKFSLVKKLLLKRKLLLQNIQIIENRIQNRAVSYTKLVHGFDFYVNRFFSIISTIGTILSIALFFYTFAFILLNSLQLLHIVDISFQNKSSLFLTLFAFLVFTVVFSRGWKSMIFFTIIFGIIMSFLLINF